MPAKTYLRNCEGCDKPLQPIEAALWSVCLDCTRARQRAVLNGSRCACRSKRRPGPVAGGGRPGARTWVPCLRCLGTIKQIS